MAVLIPREGVHALLFRIPVAARLHPKTAVRHAAVRILVHVKAVHAGGEAFQIRVKRHTEGGVYSHHAAHGGVAVFAEKVNVDHNLFLGRHRVVELGLISVSKRCG